MATVLALSPTSLEAFSLPGEQWHPIEGHPSHLVSSLGRLKGPRGIRKPAINSNGYYVFNIQVKGKTLQYLLHREVCRACHPDSYFPGAYALHKDGVRTNCHKDNLYWGTPQNNMDDRRAAGRY